MRIVFWDSILLFGGGSQLAVDLAKRLATRHDVQMVDAFGACKPYLDALKANDIQAHVLVPEAKRPFIGHRDNRLRRLWQIVCQSPLFAKLRRRLSRKIAEIDPDVIWTQSELALFFLSLTSGLWRYPVVFYACGCPDAASIHRRLRWLLEHRSALIMSISTETGRQLRLAGLTKTPIQTVFDTIDIEDTVTRSTKPLEASLPGLHKRPRFVLPATLLRTKGGSTAIQAVSRLKSQGLDPTLWFAGSAPRNDRSYLEHLEGLVKELGLSDNVHFLGWRNDVPAIMVRSDIVVLPTHTEGFGHVILEAMLLRRPVIATHVGGIKDSIEDGVNGLVFPVGDDRALAALVKRLAEDSLLVARLSANGYKTVMERFTPELHTERVAEALSRAAQSGRRRRRGCWRRVRK